MFGQTRNETLQTGWFAPMLVLTVAHMCCSLCVVRRCTASEVPMPIAPPSLPRPTTKSQRSSRFQCQCTSSATQQRRAASESVRGLMFVCMHVVCSRMAGIDHIRRASSSPRLRSLRDQRGAAHQRHSRVTGLRLLHREGTHTRITLAVVKDRFGQRQDAKARATNAAAKRARQKGRRCSAAADNSSSSAASAADSRSRVLVRSGRSECVAHARSCPLCVFGRVVHGGAVVLPLRSSPFRRARQRHPDHDPALHGK